MRTGEKQCTDRTRPVPTQKGGSEFKIAEIKMFNFAPTDTELVLLIGVKVSNNYCSKFKNC
ncbi:hypothetical protein ACI76Z_10100 [Capnocytophaga canimorsus]|uniref:hypothetical protein n=1 Tax=Capnocytophaga canimorsus TaxID=28188 RepID=UPI0038594D95